MKDKTKYLALGVGIGALILIFRKQIASGAMAVVDSFSDALVGQLSTFIPSVEGFEPHPYWDVSRYSWGYGTAAPGATGTISREKAFSDMLSHLENDFNTLRPQITRSLTAKQWAALLSFSYNEGSGNAENLVDDINAGDDTVLEPHWKEYIYANHVVNDNLVARRNKEWALWSS